MKFTSKILLALLLLFTGGLLLSNKKLKSEYNQKDKNDYYWTYNSILDQPFKHLVIHGGNITKIAYEQSKSSSVRVSKEWVEYEKYGVKAYVKNDTLYLYFPNTYDNVNMKRWMGWNTLIRVFSPELLSVTGVNTRFEMYKLNQKNITVNMSGKSYFEAESMEKHFDDLQLQCKDSSEVQFEMSPDAKGTENFYIHSVTADIQGASFVDIGRAQIDSLHLNISDSAGVLLSGGTMRKNSLHTAGKQ